MKLKLSIITLFCLTSFSAAQAQKAQPAIITDKTSVAPAKARTEDKSTRKSEPDEPAGKKTNDYVRPDSKERFRRFVSSTIGLKAIGRNAAKAGFSTYTDSPEEWETNSKGFARRFASGMGGNAIKQTTIYGLDEALQLDSRYYESERKDFGSRVKNALLSTVTARNKDGKRVIGVPRLAGTYTSGIVSREVWYPERYDYKDGLKSGTVSLGFTAAVNLIREFF
jgi:hypothetical protein